MKVIIEKFYCDRCGKEISQEEYDEIRFIDELSPVHKVCSKCYKDFMQKKQELINWLEMDGDALIVKKKSEKVCQDN